MAKNNQKPRKIAVLGGGMGALTAVMEITNKKGWRKQFDEITVYQLGWRLGGKGASGRGENGRIEEHGLHIWMGFYDNAFRLIQQAYKELVQRGLRSPDAPLATWEQAFKQHDFIVLEEHFNDTWRHWYFECPRNTLTPGSHTPLKLLDYLYMAAEWIIRHYFHPGQSDDRFGGLSESSGDVLLGRWLLKEFHKNRRLPTKLGNTKKQRHAHWRFFWAMLDVAVVLRDHWKNQAASFDNDTHKRRRFILFDLGVTFLSGLKDLIEQYMKKHGITHWYDVTSEMLEELSFDTLDKHDLRVWMKRHGAADLTVHSAVIRSFYDLVFGYENGDIDKPSFAAGVALRSILSIAFGYKGSIFWKMQAGMGDVVFTPLYQVLKERGVTFKFFHRVKNLHLSKNKRRIDAVTVGRQVTLKNVEYDPLVDVKGLPCWPSEPCYEQIVEGDELKQQHINLESFYTPWQDRETVELKRGEDFDEIILGISVGAFPYMASELINAKKNWRRMVDNVKTVRTMAMQLWLNEDLKNLGWQKGSPVMCGYVDPLNTWSDMSQLIRRENWPDALKVENIAYYCGPMEGGIPPAGDHQTPAKALERVKADAVAYLENAIGYLLPHTGHDAQPGTFDWRLLVDSRRQSGEQRLTSQYLRANIDPSERYVLSVAGSTAYRLAPDGSGVDNLYLAGDWTLNGFNAGCIEATVMSGMLASHALCGYPLLKNISGLNEP